MSAPLTDSLVRELIERHGRSAAFREPFAADLPAAEVTNPICGDVVRVQLGMTDGRVATVRLGGHGCALSQASASMAATLLAGRSWPEIRALEAEFNEMLSGGAAPASLGDARALSSVGRFPNRVRCARLIWDALGELDPEVAEK